MGFFLAKRLTPGVRGSRVTVAGWVVIIALGFLRLFIFVLAHYHSIIQKHNRHRSVECLEKKIPKGAMLDFLAFSGAVVYESVCEAPVVLFHLWISKLFLSSISKDGP